MVGIIKYLTFNFNLIDRQRKMSNNSIKARQLQKLQNNCFVKNVHYIIQVPVDLVPGKQ